MKNVWLFCLLFSIFATSVVAQKASVQAGSYRIRLGEQIELNLQAQPLDGQKVIWPTFPDSLGPHFDIVRRDTLDTLSLPDKPLIYSQKLIITSFDSGRHVLPVFDFGFFKPGGDTQSIVSDALSIEVLVERVDTTKAIKDIRGLATVPPDYWQYLVYVGLAILLVIIIYLVWRRIQKNKKPVVVAKPDVPSIPAWELALNALNAIQQEALWRQGKEKAYHSAITDVMRNYIEAQLKLPAPESTSDEILLMLRNASVTPEALDAMRRVLLLADLVKFAKGQALPSEHELSIQLCRQFVELTRPQSAAPEPGKEAADV